MCKKQKYLWFLSLLFLVGCSVDDPFVDETNQIFYLEDEFNISLIESLGEQRGLDMRVETINAQSCLNSVMNFSYSYLPNSTLHFLTLNEIIEPENCDEGDSPVVTDIALASPIAGSYNMDINLLYEIRNVGQLEITEEYYDLRLDTELGINLPYNRLNRIPDQTIWGYFAYKNEAQNFIAEEFVKDLEELAMEFDFITGEYGHFRIEDDNRFNLEVETDKDFYQTFLYRFEGSVSDLEQMINEKFCSVYQSTIDVKVFTSEGELLTCD